MENLLEKKAQRQWKSVIIKNINLMVPERALKMRSWITWTSRLSQVKNEQSPWEIHSNADL